MMDLSVVPFGAGGAVGEPGGESYRECMRNHAASLGGQAYDGCGEFMPGGEIGTLEALKCAACGCHRNFHRRSHRHHQQQQKPIRSFPPSYQPVSYRYGPISASRVGSETPPRTDGGDRSSRKRNRTKFTAEQKEKMALFAERNGWRIPRHDDVALREFLGEIGVERHVLKVWMHNNKSHLSASSAAAASAAAAGGGGVQAEAPVQAPPVVAPAAISV